VIGGLFVPDQFVEAFHNAPEVLPTQVSAPLDACTFSAMSIEAMAPAQAAMALCRPSSRPVVPTGRLVEIPRDSLVRIVIFSLTKTTDTPDRSQ
jgi:hypothetical protein